VAAEDRLRARRTVYERKAHRYFVPQKRTEDRDVVVEARYNNEVVLALRKRLRSRRKHSLCLEHRYHRYWQRMARHSRRRRRRGTLIWRVDTPRSSHSL
jgi:hypothetical protein